MAKHFALGPQGQWWWPREEGALGRHTTRGSCHYSGEEGWVDYMAPRERAHFAQVITGSEVSS